tara:strand:- start:469 stop:1293 length:825 start_codon:yes stop_codon:yes gene_type:complete
MYIINIDMYKNITNPNTGKIVPLNSKKGQKILKNYIDTITGGDISDLDFVKEVNRTQNYSVFFDKYLNDTGSHIYPLILSALPGGIIMDNYRKVLNSGYDGLQLLERLSSPQPLIYGSKTANGLTFYWCLIFIMYLLIKVTIGDSLFDDTVSLRIVVPVDGEDYFYLKIIVKDELIYPLLAAISQFTYIIARGTSVGNSKLMRGFVEYNNDPIKFKAMYQFVNKELQPLFVYKCSNNYGCGRCIQHSSSDVNGQRIVFNSTTESDDECNAIYTE